MKRHVSFFAVTAVCFTSCLSSAPSEKTPQAQTQPAFASIRPGRDLKDAELPDLAKISFDDALKAALLAAPGKTLHGELELVNGGLVYSFGIVSKDRKIHEVEIDAGNGKVLAIDVGNDD